MKSFITYLEEHLTRKEFLARKKAAKAQMVTNASERMGMNNGATAGMFRDDTMEPDELMEPDINVSPAFKHNLAIMFSNIEQRQHSAKHQEDTGDTLPIIAFHKLPEEQKLGHHYEVESAIDTLNEHPPVKYAQEDYPAARRHFEKMFSHYRSLLGRPEGDGYSKHEEMIDRHKLVKAMKMMKIDLPDLED